MKPPAREPIKELTELRRLVDIELGLQLAIAVVVLAMVGLSLYLGYILPMRDRL